MSPDQRVALEASKHGGVFTTAHALRAGLSHANCTYRVKTGRWTTIHRGVYAIAGSPVDHTQLRFAAIFATNCPSVCALDTAALIHGLTKSIDKRAVHVLQPTASSHTRLTGVTRHRTKVFLLDDFTLIDGLGVTNAARTICDIGGRFNERFTGRMVDEALRPKLLTLEQLHRTALRLGSAPGRSVRTIHNVLRDRIPGYDPGASSLEAEIISLLAKAGLPMPRIGYAITLDGIRFHLDLAWPDFHVAVELDSWEYHQGRNAFDDDRKRTNLLVLNGWTSFRFTDKTPHSEILSTLCTALGLGPGSGS
jgi:Transcriptional regulator, AbiEi antitoxin